MERLYISSDEYFFLRIHEHIHVYKRPLNYYYPKRASYKIWFSRQTDLGKRNDILQ